MNMEMLAKIVLTAMVIREASYDKHQCFFCKSLHTCVVEAQKCLSLEVDGNTTLLSHIILNDWNNAETWAKNVLGL